MAKIPQQKLGTHLLSFDGVALNRNNTININVVYTVNSVLVQSGSSDRMELSPQLRNGQMALSLHVVESRVSRALVRQPRVDGLARVSRSLVRKPRSDELAGVSRGLVVQTRSERLARVRRVRKPSLVGVTRGLVGQSRSEDLSRVYAGGSRRV